PLQLLLPTAAGERGESAPDATDRRALSGVSILRKPPAGGGIERRMGGGPEPQADSAADAADGPGGTVSKAPFEPSFARAPNLSVPVARRADRSRQPGLEQRYHLHSFASGLSLPDSGDRLAKPFCAELGTVEHARGIVLSLGAGSGVPLGTTGDLQFRSGFAVHGSRVPADTQGPANSNQYGRTRARARQRLHRTAVAIREVRIGLSRRLHQRRAINRKSA